MSWNMSRTHTPDPVDHLDLLVQFHHEDAEEDDGKDHLADGHGGVSSIPRHGVADDDDETKDLLKRGRGQKVINSFSVIINGDFINV